MPSDREVLTEMLNRAEIVFLPDPEDPSEFTVSAGTGPQNDGYPGFMAIFAFRPDGSLKSIGVWE